MDSQRDDRDLVPAENQIAAPEKGPQRRRPARLLGLRRLPAGWPGSAVLVSHNQEKINLAALALAAGGIRYRISRSDNGHGWQIEVPPDNEALAQTEIAACLREHTAPPPPAAEPFTPRFRAMHLMVSGGLCLMYAASGPWQEHSSLFAAGSAQALAITHGQFFRAVTALCLHADSLHLMSNAGIALLLLYFYFHTLGNGLGLAALVASAAAANLINAFLHGAGHDSVGFSTALFASIGILSSFQFQRHRVYGRFGRWMPLMAACALLAMLGSEGKQTDFGAHLAGLLTGLAAGYVLSWQKIRRLRESLIAQGLLLFFTVMVIFACWYSALRG